MANFIQQNLIEKNERSCSQFKEGHLALLPAKKYALVTCMDARIDPAAAFGVAPGDAHVIRNAGGNARDSIRSLVISEQLLGTNEIVLIKYTDCGVRRHCTLRGGSQDMHPALPFGSERASLIPKLWCSKNEDVHAIVEKQLGSETKQELAGLDFQPSGDLETGVRDDKSSKAIPSHVNISGWVYEVESGKVRQVV